jgi:hypothetical protein
MEAWFGLAALLLVMAYGAGGFAVVCILMGAFVLIDFAE